MKVLKKIGLGIISLGLISTFYSPEAKAGQTLVEFVNIDGREYAIKKLNDNNYPFFFGQYILKRIGSGKKQCKTTIKDEKDLLTFISCINVKLGNTSMNETILSAFEEIGFM